MDDRGEQCRLVIEAVIERALRDTSASGYCFDGCRSIALGKKQVGRDFQDSIAQLQGGSARRPAPMACLAIRGTALTLTGRDRRNRAMVDGNHAPAHGTATSDEHTRARAGSKPGVHGNSPGAARSTREAARNNL